MGVWVRYWTHSCFITHTPTHPHTHTPTQSYRGEIRMFRYATGPWSPWNIRGPSGASLPVTPEGVGPFISTFSWITWPLRVTFRNFAFWTFRSPSKRGA